MAFVSPIFASLGSFYLSTITLDHKCESNLNSPCSGYADNVVKVVTSGREVRSIDQTAYIEAAYTGTAYTGASYIVKTLNGHP